jgi:leucyl-tRNA synthetase
MQKARYDHRAIEKKWQKIWQTSKTYKAKIDLNKPKYYILDMFPYPSGAGLHVGHVTGYTGTDILARYKRLCGFNVLHPMGWDSFGLPAEQYAIRTGTHPRETTKKNIDTYRNQLQSLGFSYDWDREIATSDPSYYKWTQWIFTKLFEKGLAYEAEINVNFCPALGTVVANEEVENGKYIEGGYPVIRKPLRQWILKITAYADRLIEDLSTIDWPENLKKLQINWIGRSEGAKISFIEKATQEEIIAFTTRPDTLFGATYLVLAPEHPLVEKISTSKQQKAVEKYLKEVASKSDLERTDLAKEKTGVFTGAYAIHPITGKDIPIWISDYVLMGYGTGAIMCVPAHDERDFEFAHKFKLPIIPVYDPVITDEDVETLKKSRIEIEQEVINGNLCWTKEGKSINSSHADLTLNGLTVEEAKKAMLSWLHLHKKGEKAISFKLRDWLFSRQRYWGEPFPILHFEDGSKRALDLDELPLIPPELENFKPSGTGESPLANVPEWVNITDSKTGRKAKRETNTMPQWAGSCWYYLRFCDPTNDKHAFSKEAENYWMPVDLYVGGAEHAVLHLMYARFWHKVLYDCGIVSTKEPFQTYRYQGVVTAPSYKLKTGGYIDPHDIQEKNGKYFYPKTCEEVQVQIEKMSKSKLNGVTPNDMIDEFGADALRLYEMFMGPFDKEKIWNTDAVTGCKRFLDRFFAMAVSEKVTEEESEEALGLGYRLINDVKNDIEQMQFNTAIAKMMEFINAFIQLPKYPKKVVLMAIQALYPFAPHITEELWEILGDKRPLSFTAFPEVVTKYLTQNVLTYVIQVNGKLRARIEAKKGMTEQELLDYAKTDPQIQKHLTKEIVKTIFVPDKLLNIVL